MANEIYYLENDYFTDITSSEISIVNDAAADKEDANFPIENSQNIDVAKVTLSDDKTNIKIRFDINSASGGTKALKVFALLNHNLTGGSIKIYSFTNVDYTTGRNLEATVTVRLLDMFVRIASPTTKRYWEIDISHNGTATATEAYYKWGRVMCYDDAVILTDIEDFEKLRGYGFRNIIHKTKGGVRYAHKVFAKQERFGLTWKVRDQTNMPAELRTMYEAVSADADPFLLVPNITLTPCYYGYIEDPELEYIEAWGTSSGDLVSGLRLNFIEAVREKA